jgi:tetratricopeptide (TPR) repeat protein
MKLSTSLESGKSDELLASDYEELAKTLTVQGEYEKAENYLLNARKLYEKLKDKEKIARADREIGRIQETLGKIDAAILSYASAAHLSRNKEFRELNNNDVNRLKNISDPIAQSPYIKSNIKLLNASNKPEQQVDRVAAFHQMANVNLTMNNKEAALSNLNSILDEVKDKPVETIKVQREIAKVYAADSQKVKAIASLQQSYDMALKEGHTMEAKKSLEQLVDQYRKDNQPRKALDLYAGFIENLEPLVKSDSTLIDQKFFQAHEARIAQLEKERILKDELIRKKNTFNYVLIGSIVLILVFLIFTVKAWYSIRQKNKKIALQSLRREMNPHFIFNSLNSVNQFIAQNNELEANKYLSSYSRLMRNILENSNKDFTPLSTELEQLKEYLDLEHMRFSDKFVYEIDVDESLDPDHISIPNMLIQPQLENAVWHGLRYKESGGLLRLSVKSESNSLCVKIEDNGIGLKKSNELKTRHQKEHHSRGLTNTRERINLLNSLYNMHITIEITEKENSENGTGVIVLLRFPLIV